MASPLYYDAHFIEAIDYWSREWQEQAESQSDRQSPLSDIKDHTTFLQRCIIYPNRETDWQAIVTALDSVVEELEAYRQASRQQRSHYGRFSYRHWSLSDLEGHLAEAMEISDTAYKLRAFAHLHVRLNTAIVRCDAARTAVQRRSRYAHDQPTITETTTGEVLQSNDLHSTRQHFSGSEQWLMDHPLTPPPSVHAPAHESVDELCNISHERVAVEPRLGASSQASSYSSRHYSQLSTRQLHDHRRPNHAPYVPDNEEEHEGVIMTNFGPIEGHIIRLEDMVQELPMTLAALAYEPLPRQEIAYNCNMERIHTNNHNLPAYNSVYKPATLDHGQLRGDCPVTHNPPFVRKSQLPRYQLNAKSHVSTSMEARRGSGTDMSRQISTADDQILLTRLRPRDVQSSQSEHDVDEASSNDSIAFDDPVWKRSTRFLVDPRTRYTHYHGEELGLLRHSSYGRCHLLRHSDTADQTKKHDVSALRQRSSQTKSLELQLCEICEDDALEKRRSRMIHSRPAPGELTVNYQRQQHAQIPMTTEIPIFREPRVAVMPIVQHDRLGPSATVTRVADTGRVTKRHRSYSQVSRVARRQKIHHAENCHIILKPGRRRVSKPCFTTAYPPKPYCNISPSGSMSSEATAIGTAQSDDEFMDVNGKLEAYVPDVMETLIRQQVSQKQSNEYKQAVVVPLPNDRYRSSANRFAVLSDHGDNSSWIATESHSGHATRDASWTIESLRALENTFEERSIRMDNDEGTHINRTVFVFDFPASIRVLGNNNEHNSGGEDRTPNATSQERRMTAVDSSANIERDSVPIKRPALCELLNEPCRSAPLTSVPTKELTPASALKRHKRVHILSNLVLPSSSARSEHSRTKTKGDRFCLQFTCSRGNEYFCEIDEDYLTDRFNLTNLNTEVQYYQYALDLVTDVFDLECDDDMREQIEKSARHLYGLIHARYIVTTRGLQKMLDKYKKGDFGKCPRVSCESQALLPVGQHDVPITSAVKLYCARCEDIYNPKSSRHAAIDGAYFGTSFHGIFFQVYATLSPPKSARRYEPKIYGFKVHAAATLARWQDYERDDMKRRLKDEAGLDQHGFEQEDEDDVEDEDDEDGTNAAAEGIDDMFEGRRIYRA